MVNIDWSYCLSQISLAGIESDVKQKFSAVKRNLSSENSENCSAAKNKTNPSTENSVAQVTQRNNESASEDFVDLCNSDAETQNSEIPCSLNLMNPIVKEGTPAAVQQSKQKGEPNITSFQKNKITSRKKKKNSCSPDKYSPLMDINFSNKKQSTGATALPAVKGKEENTSHSEAKKRPSVQVQDPYCIKLYS